MKRQYGHEDVLTFLEHAMEFLAMIETDDKDIAINIQIADRFIAKSITILESSDEM